MQLLEEKKLKKSDYIVTENYHLRLKPATAEMLIEKIRLNMDTQRYLTRIASNTRTRASCLTVYSSWLTILLGRERTCNLLCHLQRFRGQTNWKFDTK